MSDAVKYTSKHLDVKAQQISKGGLDQPDEISYVVTFPDHTQLTIPEATFNQLFRETGHESSDAVNESLAAGRIDLKQPKGKARAAK